MEKVLASIVIGSLICGLGYTGFNEYNKLGRMVDENQKRVLVLSETVAAERAKQTELEIKIHTLETENAELKQKAKKYRANLLKKKTLIEKLKK